MHISKVEIPSTSRWNRTYLLTVNEFAGFPRDIARIVSEYVITHQYLDWIDKSKIVHSDLCENPNAYYSGLVTANDNPIDYAQNPAMRAEILANWEICIRSERIIENPAVFPEVIKSGIRIFSNLLPYNKHPDAVRLTLEKYLDEQECSVNPMLIKYISKPNNSMICANPAAIDIIQSLSQINYNWLSCNPHPWAIEHLRLNQDKIVWGWFSTNPSIFEERTDPKLLDVLSK